MDADTISGHPHYGFGRNKKDTVSADVLLAIISVPDVRNIRQLDVLLEHLECLQTSQLSDLYPSQVPLKVWHVIFTLCARSVSSPVDLEIMEAFGIDINLNYNLTVASSLSQANTRLYKQSLKPSIHDRSKLLLSSWLHSSVRRKEKTEYTSLERLVASFLISDRPPSPVKRLLRDAPRKNYDIMSQLQLLSDSQTASLPPASPESVKLNKASNEMDTLQCEPEDVISDSEEESDAVIFPEMEMRKFKYGDLQSDSKRESPSLDDSFGILETMPHLVALRLRSPVSRSRSPKRQKSVVKDSDILVFGHQSLCNRLNPEKGGYNVWKLLKYWLLVKKTITDNNILYGDLLHWIFAVLEKNFLWELSNILGDVVGAGNIDDLETIVQRVLIMDKNSRYFVAKHINAHATLSGGILLNNLIEQIGGSKFDRIERIIDMVFGDLVENSTYLVIASCYDRDKVGLHKRDDKTETIKKIQLRVRVLYLVYSRIRFNDMKSFIDSNPIGSYATSQKMMQLIFDFLTRMSVANLQMFFDTAVYWGQDTTYLGNLDVLKSSSYSKFVGELAIRQFVDICGTEYISSVPLLKQYSEKLSNSLDDGDDFSPLGSLKDLNLEFWLRRVKEKGVIEKSIVDQDGDLNGDKISKMNSLLDWIIELHKD